ncbi:MAG: GNAT family N-acetyltransferase [Rhizobiales bacterium]|nr:GNAT family N-acetyltransferase [Hyphomicrobiales bacterium]
MTDHPPSAVEVAFRRISAATVTDVCDLSDTLSDEQRAMVADNGQSIAEAHFSENAWFRAIYADDALAGFVMLHIGADHDDGIDCPGVFLWRLMIAGPFQGKGIGRQAIALLVRDLSARGITELYTSYGRGAGSPEAFYRRLGFEPTGDTYDDEVEAVLTFAR